MDHMKQKETENKASKKDNDNVKEMVGIQEEVRGKILLMFSFHQFPFVSFLLFLLPNLCEIESLGI